MATATQPKVAKSATATQPKEDSILKGESRLKFDYVKFENVGDNVIGLYVGKFKSTSAKYGYEQENYILIREGDGKKVVVSGRNTRKSDGTRVIFGIEKIPYGERIAFIFDREMDTGKGNPAKIIEIGYEGVVDKQAYLDFKSKYNMEDIAPEEETTTEEATEDETLKAL